MTERMEFRMSDQSLERLLDACKPVPYIVAGGISPRSQQENANDAWAALGREMGFDYMTAQSVPGKSGHYFTAVPVTQDSASPASPAPEQAQAATAVEAVSAIDHAQRVGHIEGPEFWQDACRLFRIRSLPDDCADMARLRTYIEEGLLVAVRPSRVASPAPQAPADGVKEDGRGNS